MLGDSTKRARVCNTLAHLGGATPVIDAQGNWTSDVSARMGQRNTSPGMIMVLIALHIAHGRGEVHFGDVVDHLDAHQIAAVFQLALAVKADEAAIDQWLATFEHEGAY